MVLNRPPLQSKEFIQKVFNPVSLKKMEQLLNVIKHEKVWCQIIQTALWLYTHTFSVECCCAVVMITPPDDVLLLL